MVVAGASASGIAVSKILLAAGVGDIAVSDSKGLIYAGREGLNPVKAALAEVSETRLGLVARAGRRCAAPTSSSACPAARYRRRPIEQMVSAITFLLSNPDPEIHPDIRAQARDRGRDRASDFPNQINNSLAFPGVFRGRA